MINAKRALAATAAALVAVAGLSACSNSEEPAASSESTTAAASTEAADEAAFPRTIETVDGTGAETEVTIEAEPENIVSASVSLTGSLLALEAPVVGTGSGTAGAPMYPGEEGFGAQWEDAAVEQGVESLYELEPNAEAILAQEPDLVVMSNVGQDNATAVYDQLSAVVPVVVIDYSDQSWQDVTTYLGEVTGREDKAEELIADYETKVAEAAEQITLPEQPVNIVTVAAEGAMNFFTEESAQGQLFTDLGFEIGEVSEDLVGETAQGGNRGDITGINAENVPVALNGASVFVLNTKPDQDQVVRDTASLAENTAVAEDRVYGLPAWAFRLDYFSATDLVDYLTEQFA